MSKKNFIYKVTFFFFVLAALIFPMLNSNTYSDDVEDLEQQLEQTEEQKEIKQKILEETEAELNSIINSSWSLSKKVYAIEAQIKGIEEDISTVKKDIEVKEREILDQEAVIRETQSQIEAISKRLYINSRYNLLELLMGSEVANDIVRSYVLKKYTLNKQMEDLEQLNFELGSLTNKQLELKNQRARLEAEEDALAESKVVLAQQQAQLQEQIAANNAEKGHLEKEITLLNDKITKLQEAILIARSGSFVPSVGSVPTGSDYNASAEGFRTKAPSGYFAIFSFGAYTHRVGMSQYGAQGRAESGQNANQILQAYFNKSPESKDTSGDIKVEGYGSINFETSYMYGIAEMPHTWNVEALKAQAIVARSYAYRYKIRNQTICTTQSCQVFLKSKSESPPSQWKQAVDETRGIVLIDVGTYYSSTTGGYLSTSGWDTTDGVGGGNWTERAYESIAGSPWFYKSWYRNGLYTASDDCGRGNPWLSEAEMSDILNTWLVMKRDGVVNNVDDSRIIPVTVNSCSYGGLSGNPYSMSEMRSLLAQPVTEIIGYPSVKLSSDGQTTSVLFSTNRGVVSIPGMEFKAAFNTRAPGFLSIPQSSWSVDFAFFNVERK